MRPLKNMPGIILHSGITQINTRQIFSRAAFLDRDGVINKDFGYVHRWEDFEFCEGAIEGLRLLQLQGFGLFIVTNQSGIGRGYYTDKCFRLLMEQVDQYLLEKGVVLNATLYCPHLPDAHCTCRKPRPGQIKAAKELFELDLSRSLLFGDKQTDLECAKAAGISDCYLVESDSRREIAGPPPGVELRNLLGWTKAIEKC